MVKIYFQRKYVELAKGKLLTWETRKIWLLGYLTLSTQQNYVLENSSQFRVTGDYFFSEIKGFCIPGRIFRISEPQIIFMMLELMSILVIRIHLF